MNLFYHLAVWDALTLMFYLVIYVMRHAFKGIKK